MNFGIDVTTLKHATVDTDEMFSRIMTGKAIVFTGAGFSKKAMNMLNEEPPLAKDLSKKIGKLARLANNSEELMFTSGYYLKHGDRSLLLNLLKDSFVLKEVTEAQKLVCSLPWRRLYTTNYDNSIEMASLLVGKRIESLDIDSDPKDYTIQNTLCVHLNGIIDKAIVSDLDSKIKLSNSSYLTAHSFMSSKWHYVFKRDLETASAIVFIGYSMYDMDVQRLLYQTDNLIEKTYFIVREDATYEDTFFLSEFGHVLPIGVDGFADLIGKIDLRHNEEDDHQLDCFELRELNFRDDIITDTEIKDLLLYGKYNETQIDTAISNNFKDFFIIERELIKDSLRLIEQENNILVHSELGNGKTIYLEILAHRLTQNGYKVYFYKSKSEYDDELAEVDLIISRKQKSVLVIDGFIKAENLLKHISINYPEEVSIVISDRSSVALRASQLINKLDINFSEISLDQLSNNEITHFVDLLDNQGLWEEMSALSNREKQKRIAENYNGQISGILLGLLNSPSIQRRIKRLTESLFENQLYKDTIFAIALCDIIDVSKTSYMVSEIADNNIIYDMQFRRNDEFRSLYNFIENGNSIETKSSLMSLVIINHCYTDSYIRHKLIDVVKRFDKLKEVSHDSNNIFRSLLRFHVLERLMPQNQKALNNYYMELKQACPWLKDSPHYWLQYAMCRLSIYDTVTAQTYLNDSYELARERDNYDTASIDTQQARLYIIDCINTNDSTESFDLFRKAHVLILALPDDGYKYRQVLPYKEVFEKKYRFFAKKNQVYFEHACKALIQQITLNEGHDDELTLLKRISFMRRSREMLEDLVQKILLTRK